MPALSICVPAYKAERYLAETLESVRTQTFGDWELLVTEDGSRDGTEAIVRAFATTVTQPVRYLRHDPNRGLPATRNAGFVAAVASRVALLDADDLWLPNHLHDLITTAEATGADLVHAGSILFDSVSGRDISVRAPSPEVIQQFPRSLFESRYIIQPASVMLTRELWKKVGGFNPTYRFVEDREMWMRCARAKARFAYTGRETCRYRKHPEALSNRAPEMAEFAAAVFDQHLDWDEIPKTTRVTLASNAWAAAAQLRQRKQPALAALHYSRACAIHWSLDKWLRALICRVVSLAHREERTHLPQ